MCRYLMVLLFIVGFAGCTTGSAPLQPPVRAAIVGPQEKQELSAKSSAQLDVENNDESPLLQLSDARPDLMAVVLAVFREMLQPGDDALVFFASPLLRDESIPVTGFALTKVVLERDEQKGDDPLFRRIGGTFQLRDTWLRTMYWSFAAEYVVQDSGIIVLSSAVLPLYELYEEVLFYVVEEQRVAPLRYLKEMSYREMLELVAANALTPEQLRVIKGAGNYKIFAFNMVLAEPQRRLALYTNDAYGGVQVDFAHSSNADGWNYAMLEGRFRFNQPPHYDLTAVLEQNGRPSLPLGSINSLFE